MRVHGITSAEVLPAPAARRSAAPLKRSSNLLLLLALLDRRRTAADGVADPVLEAIDATVPVPALGAGLLLRIALAVEALRPRGVRLREPARAPQAEGPDEEPEHPVRDAELGERDQARENHDREDADAQDEQSGGVVVEVRGYGARQHEADEAERHDGGVHG